MPRFVAGGAGAQNAGRRMEQSPFGRGTISAGVDNMIGDSTAARSRIASGVGTVLEPEGMGDTAISGVRRALGKFGQRSERVYDRAERLSGDARVGLPTAQAEVARQVAELEDTPGVVPKMLDTLKGLSSRMGGTYTPASIRRMRTILTDQFIESGMQRGDASRRAGLVTQAAEADMVNGLAQAGKINAARAWQQASRVYKAQQDTIEEVFTPIMGANNDKSAEEVARALQSAARSNGGRIASLLKSIPKEDADTIRASLINQLGRSNSGQQNAAGEAFSLDTFLTHWDQIKGARGKIFDRETLEGLNHLAAVAQRAKATNRARGVSNTGADVWAVGGAMLPASVGIGGAVAGSPVTAVGGFFAAASMALAQYGGAKLLAAPGFAKRLAATPTAPRAAARYWSSPWVAQMARTQPTIANDLAGFQQTVVRGIGGLAEHPLAASQSDEEDRRQRR